MFCIGCDGPGSADDVNPLQGGERALSLKNKSKVPSYKREREREAILKMNGVRSSQQPRAGAAADETTDGMSLCIQHASNIRPQLQTRLVQA